MGRKIRGIFYIAAILLTAGCGKEEETENVFSDGKSATDERLEYGRNYRYTKRKGKGYRGKGKRRFGYGD